MEIRGHYKNGVVVLSRRTGLKEGTEVIVVPAKAAKPRSRSKKGKTQTLLERLAPVVGIAKGLPSDYAENHDHYLHGLPKK